MKTVAATLRDASPRGQRLAEGQESYLPSALALSVEEITPAKCLAWMQATGEFQRETSASVVEKYEADLRAGNFKLNGESIIIDEFGGLADGKHRAMACINTGCSFQSVVVRGVRRDPSVYMTTNSGKPRSFADSYRVCVGGSDVLAHSKRWPSVAVLLASDGCSGKASLSRSEMMTAMSVYRDVLLWLHDCVGASSGFKPAPVLAAVGSAWINSEPAVRLEAFLRQISTGMVEDPATDSAVITLRNAMHAGTVGTGNRGQRHELFLKTQRAVQAFVAGTSLAKVYAPLAPVYSTKTLMPSK